MTKQDIFLCDKADLEKTGAFGTSITAKNGELNIVVINMSHVPSGPNSHIPKDDEYKAYINSCPHLSIPMETFEHEFLDLQDPSQIICSTHGARFRTKDGFCLSGPCSGSSLTPIPLTFTEESIYIKSSDKHNLTY